MGSAGLEQPPCTLTGALPRDSCPPGSAQALRRGRWVIPTRLVQSPSRAGASGDGSSSDSTTHRPSPPCQTEQQLSACDDREGTAAHLTYLQAERAGVPAQPGTEPGHQQQFCECRATLRRLLPQRATSEL